MLTCIPIIQIVFTTMAIGKEPKDLQLGILNHEIENCSNLTDFCDSKHLSCNFLDDLRSKDFRFDLKIFENFEDANIELKKGKIPAFFVLAKNFTKVSLQFTKKSRQKFDVIEVYQDGSDYIISSFIKNVILETFFEFIENLGNCKNGKKPIWPIRRTDVHGKLSFNFQASLIAPLSLMLSNYYKQISSNYF